MANLDIVFFAVRAALRLSEQARQAYVDTTRRRELSLPLPAVNVGWSAAFQWFSTVGAEYVTGDSPLAKLYGQVKAARGAARQGLGKKLLPYYFEYRLASDAEDGRAIPVGDVLLDPDEWLALFRVRQLTRGEDEAANRTLLSRTIGTVVEIGVDWFATGPGAVEPGSRRGRLFAAVVLALDGIEFSEVDAAKDDWLSEIAGRLVVAAIETIGEAPEVVARDETVAELVQISAKAVAEDVLRYVDAGTSRTLEVGDWAETVFRGLLRSAGARVLAEPAKYLGVDDEARGDLIRKVGKAAIGLAVTDTGLDLPRVLSGQGLETMLDAVLDAVAEHPELLGESDNEGITAVISEAAKALKDLELVLTTDVLPELVRIVLERTGANLELIWPNGAKDPKKHLLLVAAKSTLGIVTKKPAADAMWTVRFSGDDALGVVEDVVDALAANPTWLLEGAEKIDENLRAALGATLDVIRERGDAKLLSKAVAVEVLGAAATAVALRQEFVAELGPAGEPLVAAAVDAVLSAVFAPGLGSSVKWQVLRDEAVVTAVSVSLDRLAMVELTLGRIETLRVEWKGIVEGLEAGRALDWDAIEARLEAALVGGDGE